MKDTGGPPPYPHGPPNPKPSTPLSLGASVWIGVTVLGALGWLFLGDWRLLVAGFIVGVAAGLIAEHMVDKKGDGRGE